MGIIQRVFAPGSRDADSTPLLRQAVFTLGFATLAALALLPEEFEHYRRLLRLPEDAGMRIRITLIIGAKTLAMLSAGLGIAGLLARRGHLASARNLSLIWSLLVVAYVVLDLSLQRLTGNHGSPASRRSMATARRRSSVASSSRASLRAVMSLGREFGGGRGQVSSRADSAPERPCR